MGVPCVAKSHGKVIRDKGGGFPSVATDRGKVIQDKGGVPSVATDRGKVIRDKGGGFPSVATGYLYEKRIRSEFYLTGKLLPAIP